MSERCSFDLVEEPWLPCVERQGGQLVYLGLRDTLVRAHELRELVDPSPLVTAALHRMLLAVLHRVVGPRDMGTWLDLWRAGRWDAGPLEAYLAAWRPRFDLFHAERPFFQTARVGEEYAGAASKLLLELASGNNATLFDHTLDAHYRPLEPGLAARTVVTFQAFAPGGLVSFERNQGQHRSATAAPLARGALALVRGDSLFETLLLNLLQYDPARGTPRLTTPGDRPAWESGEDVLPGERAPLGHLDYLTWQSRRLRLLPEQDANGGVVVRKAVVMKGAQLPTGQLAADWEQMVGFKSREKPAPNQEPYLAIGFSEDRAFWRDSQALLDTFHSSNPASKAGPPRTVRWLHDVATTFAGELDHGGDQPPALDLLGLTGDRAKLLFWRHERLPLPVAYLGDPFLVQALQRALGWAEGGGEALRRAVGRLATLALVPDAGQGGREPDRKLVGALAAHLDAGRAYWSSLEPRFKRFMLDLPRDTSPDGQPDYGQTLLPAWREQVGRAARVALVAATSGFDGSGRTLKASAAADRTLDYWLAKLLGRRAAERKETLHATG